MSVSYAETVRRHTPAGPSSLLDRPALADELDRRAAAGSSFGVALLRITDVDAVRCNMGWSAAAVVVREVGIRLAELAEDRSAVAGCLDDDEFVVLLSALDTDAQVVAAWAMHEAAGDLLVVKGNWIMPSTVVGVAVAAPGDAPADVLHRAGVAMARAATAESVVASFASSLDAPVPPSARPWVRPYPTHPGTGAAAQAGAA